MTRSLTLEIQRYDKAGRWFLPTSFAQRRLWFIHELEPESPAYNISQVLTFRGPLNFDALRGAIEQIVARHEILRTTFEVFDGEPVQIIDPNVHVDLHVTDYAKIPSNDRMDALEKLIEDVTGAPFRLDKSTPIRLQLVRLDTDHSALIATMHHIIADGWSLGIFVRELSQFYNFSNRERSPRPAELSIQYSDFTLWQHRWRQSPTFEKQLKFWRDRLLTAPRDLAICREKASSRTRTSAGAMVRFDLPKELTSALRALSTDSGATLFMTLLSIFQVLLYRYSGQEDFLIGTVVANRNRVELEPLIGFFVNTLVIRSDTIGNPTFLDLLRRVRATSLEAHSHQDLPFELIVESLGGNRRPGSNPLFQILFVLENTPLPDFSLADVEVGVKQIHNSTSKFDLTLFAIERGETVEFALEYAVELFPEVFVQGMARHFLTLLEQIVAAPSSPILDYHLTRAEEDAQLLSCGNGSKTEYGPTLLHQLIEKQATESPLDVALIFGDEQITYGELDLQANKLAQHLAALGVTVGMPVALFLDRSADLIIAMLATLKAGGAYLPLDTTYPISYVSLVLQDAAPAVIITTRRYAASLKNPAHRLVVLDDDRAEIESRRALPPNVCISQNDLAYVLYTSGSTGRPKGVLVEHRSILNISCWIRETLEMDRADRGLLKTPIGFDAAAREIFPILISGGALLIAPPDAHRDAQCLAELICQKGITVFHCVPAILRHLLDEPVFASATKLRAVMSGGESLPETVAASFFRLSKAALFNVYGPTETTVDSLFHRVKRSAASGPIPIGRPVANTSVYLLDSRLRPVPMGVVGELYIGGVGVARGYLNQPQLTAERFLPDPFRGRPGSKMYKTGDLGRYLPDGTIEYLGRADEQVKSSGCRVELGEIENTLLSHPGVKKAAAALKSGTDGETRLCAYITPNADWKPIDGDFDQESLATGVITDWQEVFARTYSEETPSDPKLNTVGWKSSYSLTPFPVAVMEEYVEHTITRLLQLKPKKILEIGCGTGLLLFPLAAHCDRYVGTDFCAEIIEYLRQRTRTPELAHVELQVKKADQLSCYAPGSFDLIILNSVVQYFPSYNYLRKVLQQIRALLAPDGAIFVGDVRDARLQQLFCESVQLYRAADATTALEIRRLAADQLWRDEELLLHPGAFLEFAEELQCRVQFLLKGGASHNELNKFRYDVLLRSGVECGEALQPRKVAYNSELSGVESIIRRLSEESGELVAIIGVPNARLSYDESAGKLLADHSHDELPAASIRNHANVLARRGIDPDELKQKARLGDNLTLTLSPDPCCFDIIYNPSHAAVNTTCAEWSELNGDSLERVSDPLRLRRNQLLAPTLRQFIAERLPSHMVPHKFAFLANLPLLPNGKLDRLALPEPETRRPQLKKQFLAPRTSLQQRICDVWKDVLQIDHISLDDNFFELGGHSLLATQVMARIRDRVNGSIRLRDIFEFPTIAGLALLLQDSGDSGANPQQFLIPHAEQNGPLPLSYAQQRLWFIEQMNPGNPVYIISHALRVSGSLDLAAFRLAITKVVERQQSLRTRFPSFQGVPSQAIAPSSDITVSLVDLSNIAENCREEIALQRAHEESSRSFDLATGPLFRVTLFRLSAQQHLILLVMHHIISDGWSMGVLIRELSELYRAEVSGLPSALSALPVNYLDFALWQRKQLTGDRLEQLRNYWQSQLGQTPSVLQLPMDYVRPKTQCFRGEVITFAIEREVTLRLIEFGTQRGATLFMTMLAVFQVLLGRLSGLDDFVIGTVIANRNVTQLEPLIGFFVNMLALRADLSGAPSFDELLARVRETTLGAYEHQDLPFEQLIDFLQVDRNTNYQAVFQVLFVLQNTSLPEPSLSGLQSERVRLKKDGAMFDLSLEFRETANGLVGALEYNAELFERRTAERLIERYRVLIHSLMTEPERVFAEVNLMPSAELDELIRNAKGPTPEYVNNTRLEKLIELQAKSRPEKVAVKFLERNVSYAELDSSAKHLATLLQAAGAGPERVVGILVERSPETVVSLLGVLKSGAAFTYLDPNLPEQRLRFLLSDTKCEVIVTNNACAHLIENWQGRSILVDDPARVTPSEGDVASPQVFEDLENLAYVTYTSGSTGIPKAVLIPHCALIDRIHANQQVLPRLQDDDTFLHCYSFNYDGGIMSLFWPLAVGATVIFQPLEEIGDMERVVALMQREQVTVIDSIPPVLRLLFRSPNIKNCLSLRQVITGGESCPADLPDIVLHSLDVCFSNQYGPSEATVNATSWSCDRTTWSGSVSIGRPLPNTVAVILDDKGAPCPVGVRGELYIGGPSLARGYLRRPELTAESFVIAKVGSIPSQRFYRTGDLARLLNDGTLAFCGRRDRQVQIRGMRVELSEVESSVREHPAVQDAIVQLVEGPDEIPRLVAYVLPRSDRSATTETNHASERRLDEWAEVFEDLFASPHEVSDPLRDFVGWDSSYTSEPLAPEEMTDWLEQTLTRVKALRPERVLEIGCGMGLLLFGIAPYCDQYDACDISRTALAHIDRQTREKQLGNVRLCHAFAHEIDKIFDGMYDTVILNSVIQYFPDANYLTRVLQKALERLKPQGRLFIGDVRNLFIQEAFHFSIELARAAPDLTIHELRQRVALRLNQDNELAVAPGYFAAFAARDSNAAGARILLKRGKVRSELTDFRYDVLIERGNPELVKSNGIVIADWNQNGGQRKGLEQALREERPDVLTVRGVPNKRLSVLTEALRLLTLSDVAEKSVGWLRATLGKHDVSASWEPDEIWEYAERCGYSANLRPSYFGAAEFDAFFWRDESGEALVSGAEQAAGRSFASFDGLTSNPVRDSLSRHLAASVRQHLKGRLPGHMVPAQIVMVAELPPSGNKLTAQDMLANRTIVADDGGEVIAPRTLLEVELAQIWSQLLKVDLPSIHSDFFALGGHSLLAAQLVSGIRHRLGIEISVRQLFESPTVATLSHSISKAFQKAKERPCLKGNWVGDKLSFTQLAIWQRENKQTAAEVNHIGLAFKLVGFLDYAVLKRSLAAVCSRHDILRMSIRGTPVDYEIVLTPAESCELTLVTLDGKAPLTKETQLNIIKSYVKRSLDLERQGTTSFELMRFTPGEHVLIMRLHPIAFDGWSVRVFLRELAEAFREESSGNSLSLPPTIQYLDIARQEHERATAGLFSDRADYWRSHLNRDLCALAPKPSIASDKREGTEEFLIPADQYARIKAAAVQHKSTPFSFFLAAYAIALASLFGDRRLVIAITSAGRLDSDYDSVIGPLANDLPVTIELSESETHEELLNNVRKEIIEAVANEDVPWSYLRQVLALENFSLPTAFPRAALVLHQERLETPALPEIHVESLEVDCGPPNGYDLRTSFSPSADRLLCRIRFNPDTVEADCAKKVALDFLNALDELVNNPGARIGQYSTLQE